MTAFETGFMKYAEECGLSNYEAAHILKRASDHPGTQEMFKQLPEEEETSKHSSRDLELLSELLKQDYIDQQMNQGVKTVPMQ